MNQNKIHDDSADNTAPKTLWTLTMIDVLFDDLIKDRPDQNVQMAMKELYAKNVKPSYLVRKVARDLGGVYSVRLRRLIEDNKIKEPQINS